MIVVFASCNQGRKTIDETPTRGKIKVSFDESYTLLGDAEEYTFEKTYKYADITICYKPETEVVADLLNDSARIIMISRELTQNEENILKKKQLIPKTTKIAKDAIAIIVNNSNPDTMLLFNDLYAIFKGEKSRWTDLNPKSGLQNIKVVFDNNNSGNVRYIVEKFKLNQQLPENCFAVNSNPEVIEFVKNNRNAMGIISVNWISDPNDSLSGAFLKMINVAYIGDPNNIDGNGDYYRPYPGNIAEGSYPLIREVYIINREYFTGLGSGFAQFIAGDKGQRIVRRAGLVPAQIPIRLVEIKQ